MRKLLCVLLAATMAAALWACGPQEDGAWAAVWFAAESTGQQVPATAVDSQPYTGAGTVPAMMRALLAGPQPGTGLENPFPKGTQLLGWSREGDVVTVDLSQPYGDLSGVDLTLANCCIVLTLTQIDGVEGVRVTLNGGELPNGMSWVLRPGDLVFSGVEEEPVELSAALYFRRAGTDELGYELRVLRLTEEDVPAQAVLEALLAGPQDTGLRPLLPEGLEIRSVRLENGICYVDLSSQLLEMVPAAQEDQQLLIDSIVNTLCSLGTVDAVQLQVEGQDLVQYGALELSGPLRPREEK